MPTSYNEKSTNPLVRQNICSHDNFQRIPLLVLKNVIQDIKLIHIIEYSLELNFKG